MGGYYSSDAIEEMNHLREAELRKMFRPRQSFNTMLMKVSRRLRFRDEKQAKCSSGSSINTPRRLELEARVKRSKFVSNKSKVTINAATDIRGLGGQ